ncbi:hypothetical protein os4_36850 (plasmid) [Comamonadaceae bacterium OS-4]|nr:hypothetical protein os4_36850 [Comamonadaceae bacterium OS-4]
MIASAVAEPSRCVRLTMFICSEVFRIGPVSRGLCGLLDHLQFSNRSNSYLQDVRFAMHLCHYLIPVDWIPRST